jgi:hypothetical protein
MRWKTLAGCRGVCCRRSETCGEFVLGEFFIELFCPISFMLGQSYHAAANHALPCHTMPTPRSKNTDQQTNELALSLSCSKAQSHDIAVSPGPFSTAGAGDSTRCFFISAPPSTCGRLLTSVNAGLFTADGGLYAPRLGGPPPPGMPIRRVGSTAGLTKLDRLGPLFCCWFCCCGPLAAFARALFNDSRMIGADLFGFTPCVLRIEGLSACGLNAAGWTTALPSAAWVRKLALRPVTKPAGIPAGGSVGIGGWYSSGCALDAPFFCCCACPSSADEEVDRLPAPS